MRRFFPILLVLTATGTASAQEAGDRVYNGAAGDHAIQTPLRVGDPEISLDGIADEPAWDDAAVLTGFTQYDPSEGLPASQDTEVRVFVTDDAIWFAVHAWDDNPNGIRASMAERDEVARNDDYVRIVLDTFNDQRRAYVFTLNPFGVQQDGIWLEGGRRSPGGFGPPIDDNPDFLWDSGGRLHESGYTLEVRIPFKSLRFPRVETQSWGIQVFRRIQRNGYQQSWVPSFAEEPNKLQEAGSLMALEQLDPGLFLQLNPVFTGSRVGQENDAGVFGRSDPEGEFGLNLTYGLTSNLTLDGTVNPDFSQVEADAGQIAVNERFALFFPEQRPFFLEGTEIFGLPQNLVFTRTIANPIAGAKLTGKVGRANIGYLGAIDQFADDDDVFANLVRFRQDVGGSATLGALYTDRTRDSDEFNRVAGLDGRFLFGGRNTFTFQGARSWDRDPGEDTTEGSLAYLQLQRAGRRFQTNLSFLDIDDDFRAESGFLRRTGEVQIQLRETRINWFGKPGALFERVGPGIELQGYWDHDDFWNGDGLKEAEIQLQWTMSLRNNISVWMTGSRRLFDFDDTAYEGLFVNEGGDQRSPFRPDQDLFDGLYNFRIFAFFSGWEKLRGRLSGNVGETPIFDSRTGSPVEPADTWSGDLSLSLFPTTSLRMELGLRHSSISRKRDGEQYSEATIPRIRAQYQFSRSFFVRGIFEYSSQERADLLNPVDGRPLEYCDGDCAFRTGSDQNDFSIEALMAFEPSPGTVFFLGYSRLMEDIGSFRFEDIRTRQDGLFIKLSYLFRM